MKNCNILKCQGRDTSTLIVFVVQVQRNGEQEEKTKTTELAQIMHSGEGGKTHPLIWLAVKKRRGRFYVCRKSKIVLGQLPPALPQI